MKTLKERFYNEILPAFMKEYKITNMNAAPVPTKIVLNMGLGEALKDAGILDTMEKDLMTIAGQKPVRTKSTKSIADFTLKKGDTIGLKVTLRRDRMWEFLDKLINIVLPRVKDFRGVSGTAFDAVGNYTLGVTEHTIFPEIDPSKVSKVKGLSIGITLSEHNKEQNKDLLKRLGFIYKEQKHVKENKKR